MKCVVQIELLMQHQAWRLRVPVLRDKNAPIIRYMFLLGAVVSTCKLQCWSLECVRNRRCRCSCVECLWVSWSVQSSRSLFSAYFIKCRCSVLVYTRIFSHILVNIFSGHLHFDGPLVGKKFQLQDPFQFSSTEIAQIESCWRLHQRSESLKCGYISNTRSGCKRFKDMHGRAKS